MDRKKIAVVGLGFGQYMAEHHLLRGPGAEYFELTAVCDRDPARLATAAASLGVRGVPDLDVLLREREIAAIGLFTGPVDRAEQVRKIIRAGKDVITTKPFELDAEKAEAVLREAARLGRTVHLNSPAPGLSGDFRQIKAWQEKYRLGRAIAGRHEAWYKRVEQADGSWYDDPELCPVAPVFRLGIYGINDMVRIFGEPESVQTMQSRIFTGRPTPDLAQLTIRFRNGAIATTLDGWCLQPPRDESCLTIHYENGTVHRGPAAIPGAAGKIVLCVVPADQADGRPAETVLLPEQEMSRAYQWQAFYRSLNGEPPEDPTPVEAIVHGIRILAAMKRSMKSGRTEPV